MPAPDTCDGEVWLPVWSRPRPARGWPEVALAAAAYAAPEIGGEVDAVAGGQSHGEADVAVGAFRVCSAGPLGLVEEDAYPLEGDSPRVTHGPRLLGGEGEIYKSWVAIASAERGRAARLARGAHNPKVGSSNLPPATNDLPPNVDEFLFRAVSVLSDSGTRSTPTPSPSPSQSHVESVCEYVSLEVNIIDPDCINLR